MIRSVRAAATWFTTGPPGEVLDMLLNPNSDNTQGCGWHGLTRTGFRWGVVRVGNEVQDGASHIDEMLRVTN